MNKGFEPAARYEELRLRLNALNRELTKAGVEIEASPELSNLNEDAFLPAETGVSVHQILSLAEQSVETGEDKTIAFNNQTLITSAVSVMEFEHAIVTVTDARPAHSDDETEETCTKDEEKGESKNGFFILPDGDHTQQATAAKRGAASKSAAARLASQQMCFDWS